MIFPPRPNTQAWFAEKAILIAPVVLILLVAAAPATESLVALPVVAMTALVVMAVAAAVSGSMLLRRDAAERLALAYIFLTPFQFAVFGSSLFPEHESGFGFRLSLSDLVFPLLLLALLQARRGDTSVIRSRTGLLVLGLFLAITLSWIQSAGFLGSVTRFSTGKFAGLIYLVMLSAALVDVIRDRSLWARAVDALALSGVAAGVIGLAGWLAWSFGSVSTYLVENDRLTSTMFGDPNIFASFMSVTLALALMRAWSGSPRSRWFWAAAAGVALLALILTQSRSGYMGAVAGLAVLALWLRPSAGTTAFSGLILLGVLAWAGYTWAGSPTLSAIEENPRFSSETLESRIVFWERGVGLLKTNALPGIGIGTSQQINPHEGLFTRLHNTYLTIMLELGLPGILALGLVGTAVAQAVGKARHRLRGGDGLRLVGVASALIAMLVFAFWVDALYQRHLWILIALALASPSLVPQHTLEGKVVH